METLFYHLTEQPLERALPVLVERSLARGWRVVVQTDGERRTKALSDLLWTFRPDSFVPHGHAGENGDHAADHPVWLTHETDDPNGAQIRFLVAGAEPGEIEGYERAIFMFDGLDDAAVAKARQQWKARLGKGKLLYWRQTEGGGWEKAMEKG